MPLVEDPLVQMVLLPTALCLLRVLMLKVMLMASVNAFVGSFGAEGTVADSFRVLRCFGHEGAVDCAAVYPFGVEGTVAGCSSVFLIILC